MKSIGKNQKSNNKMGDQNPNITMIPLSVNDLSKTHQLKDRLSKWVLKSDPTICCLQETHLKYNDIVLK